MENPIKILTDDESGKKYMLTVKHCWSIHPDTGAGLKEGRRAMSIQMLKHIEDNIYFIPEKFDIKNDKMPQSVNHDLHQRMIHSGYDFRKITAIALLVEPVKIKEIEETCEECKED